jgi:hypothetical protein
MQKCLDAHSGLPVASSSINPKHHVVLKEENVSVRVDINLLKEIEANAKLNPNKIGSVSLDRLLSSFETAHHSIESHGLAFVQWVPERVSALQEVSGVLFSYGFAQQGSFCNELDRIWSQCESARHLTERFPAILAKCNDVKLPPRLYDLVPLSPKYEPHMSLFRFLTLSVKSQDPVRYWDDRVARLKDASTKNGKEAHDTRAQYDLEIRKCEEARSLLKDCLSRSQQIASSVIVDLQCISDAKRELEQACNLISIILLGARAAQNLVVKARKKGVIHQFDTMGSVFMKWNTDLETFDHAPRCLEAFLAEVRQRRSYHGCLAAFEEMIHSRLDAAKAKETARRLEFQTRFSAHMPSEFREMLIEPVPALQNEKRLRSCGYELPCCLFVIASSRLL